MIGRSSVAIMGVPSAVTGGVYLSGISTSPNSSSDFVVDPDNALAGWQFFAVGGVSRYINGSLFSFNPSPDEWYDPNGSPDATYYIKATLHSGDAPNLGDVLNSALSLGSNRGWSWEQTSEGALAGVLLIEIFDDAIETTRLAFGYYSGSVWVEGAVPP